MKSIAYNKDNLFHFRTIIMYMKTRKNSLLSFACIILLLIVQWNTCDSLRPKWCHKKKFKMDISPPGIPSCRKKITVVKCEGYCFSESKPASSIRGPYFSSSCFCCQPQSRRERKITFPCGGTVEILHIKKCQCLPC